MQKLTEEAFNALPKRKAGKIHPVRTAIAELQPGEILQIGPADWRWKTKTPSVMIHREEKSGMKKFELYKQTDVQGWIVRRLK